MSRLTDPREVVSLGTMAMSWRPTDCEAFAGAAGESMSARDVVITVWERGYEEPAHWKDFPSRPQRFGPVAQAESAGDGCGEPPGTMIHWRNFTRAPAPARKQAPRLRRRDARHGRRPGARRSRQQTPASPGRKRASAGPRQVFACVRLSLSDLRPSPGWRGRSYRLFLDWVVIGGARDGS
jgi:hypothetical protein